MITVLLIMLSGMGIGYIIRNKKLLKKINDRFTMYAIYLLLLLLGVVVGSDDKIMHQLMEIGWISLFFALVCIAGSIAAMALVSRYIIKNSEQDEK